MVVGEETRFVVHNDLVPRQALTIRLTSGLGQRALLGNVTPGAKRTLRYRHPALQGSYRLVAEGNRGRSITSTPFALFAGARVTWSIQSNLVRVAAPGDLAESRAAGILPQAPVAAQRGLRPPLRPSVVDHP